MAGLRLSARPARECCELTATGSSRPYAAVELLGKQSLNVKAQPTDKGAAPFLVLCSAVLDLFSIACEGHAVVLVNGDVTKLLEFLDDPVLVRI